MFCSNCGKELPDGSTFCSYCGIQLKQINNASNTNYNQNYSNVQQNKISNTYSNNSQSNVSKSVVTHSIFEPEKEYEIHKGGATQIKGVLNVSQGRLELTNKKLMFYGRGNIQTGCLYGLIGIFAFLIPVKLQYEIDLKDIVEVREGDKRGFARTMVISTARNTYRYTVDYNIDYWLQVVQNAVFASKK